MLDSRNGRMFAATDRWNISPDSLTVMCGHALFIPLWSNENHRVEVDVSGAVPLRCDPVAPPQRDQASRGFGSAAD
jgi:hypothetical protein